MALNTSHQQYKHTEKDDLKIICVEKFWYDQKSIKSFLFSFIKVHIASVQMSQYISNHAYLLLEIFQ